MELRCKPSGHIVERMIRIQDCIAARTLRSAQTDELTGPDARFVLRELKQIRGEKLWFEKTVDWTQIFSRGISSCFNYYRAN